MRDGEKNGSLILSGFFCVVSAKNQEACVIVKVIFNLRFDDS